MPEDALRELGFTDELLSNATIKRPVGCNQCRKGYSGRVGIYEVVQITKDLSAVIMEGANAVVLEKTARDAGFYSLRTAALKKCAAGIIGLDEVTRVTVD